MKIDDYTNNVLKDNVEYVRGWNNPTVKKSQCVAYCPYHKYYLTAKQLKQKGCLKRGCKILQKIEHVYWELRKQRKRGKQNVK